MKISQKCVGEGQICQNHAFVRSKLFQTSRECSKFRSKLVKISQNQTKLIKILFF